MVAGQEVAAARAANVAAVSVAVPALAAELPKAHGAGAVHRDVDGRHLAAVCLAVPRRVPRLNHHVGADARAGGHQVADGGERVAAVSQRDATPRPYAAASGRVPRVRALLVQHEPGGRAPVDELHLGGVELRVEMDVRRQEPFLNSELEAVVGTIDCGDRALTQREERECVCVRERVSECV